MCQALHPYALTSIHCSPSLTAPAHSFRESLSLPPIFILNTSSPVGKLLQDSDRAPIVNIFLDLSDRLTHVLPLVHACTLLSDSLRVHTELFLETPCLFILTTSESVSHNKDIVLHITIREYKMQEIEHVM